MHKIDKNNSIVIFFKILISMLVITFLGIGTLALFFQSIRENFSGKMISLLAFSFSYSLFSIHYHKENRMEITCEEKNEEMLSKVEDAMKKIHWSIVRRDEKHIIFKSSLIRTLWREYLTININENGLEIIGAKQFLRCLKEEIGLENKAKRIYRNLALSLVIVIMYLPNIMTKVDRRPKYESYSLALEAALKAKAGSIKEEEVIKILEKKIEDKSILIFKAKSKVKSEQSIDTIFIIEITKKNNKYTYEATPSISLDYFTSNNDVDTETPYSLTEGTIKINESKNLYYGIGKIMDSSYELVTENKNYKEIKRVDDNIFIIVDDKKYEKIEFEKIKGGIIK
ncbi:hypothetical protein GCM10008905_21770 [Clostridium malenominatum]|uniref:Uncharacterized protein n=1 Tax=Clostridium malenominatum TaxID=1539 RepID=A0ABN1J1E7_9CLOT